MRQAKCEKCGDDLIYVSRRTASFYVHESTGRFISNTPEYHDANTHFYWVEVADDEREGA